MRRLPWLLILGSSACSSSPGSVTGHEMLTYVTETGSTTVPIDLTTVQAAAGGKTLAVTGKADGTFTIPDAPDGPITLTLPNGEQIVTSDRTIDLDWAYLGRQDETYVSDSSTILSFTLDGLDAYAAGDVLEAYVGNTGDFIVMPATTVGATSVTDLQTTLSPGLDFLVDSSKGDVLYLTQLRGMTGDNGQTYQTMDRYLAQEPQVTTPAGATTAVTGSLAAVTRDRTFHLAWKRSTWTGDMGPNVGAPNDVIFISATPGGLSYGSLLGSADLLIYAPAPGATDLDAGDVSYGMPFPSSWGVIASVLRYAYATFQVGSMYFDVPVYAGESFDASTLGTASPFAATLGPVASLTIDGKDSSATQAVSAAPTIAWSAPSLGSPTSYIINVEVLDPQIGFAQSVFYAATTETSFALPPGTLESGKSYVAVISAVAGDPSAPFRDTLPHVSVGHVTNVFTVSGG